MHFGLIDYTYLDSREGNNHHRRCIDGKITGRGCCVGYCRYTKHTGFLTAEHYAEHRCAEKGCHYFLPKPKHVKPDVKRNTLPQEILSLADRCTTDYEGLRILRAELADNGNWLLKYVTISNDYPVAKIAAEVSSTIGETVVMINLNYDFDIAAQLILSR